MHLNQTDAVSQAPESGNCVYHVIDVSNFCGSTCDIEIDGKLVRVPNLPANIDRLLLGVEVESASLIPIAVAELIE